MLEGEVSVLLGSRVVQRRGLPGTYVTEDGGRTLRVVAGVYETAEAVRAVAGIPEVVSTNELEALVQQFDPMLET